MQYRRNIEIISGIFRTLLRSESIQLNSFLPLQISDHKALQLHPTLVMITLDCTSVTFVTFTLKQ